MRTYPDCIPCFIRQSLEAARLVSDDENLHRKILVRALRTATDWNYSIPPPGLGQGIHRDQGREPGQASLELQLRVTADTWGVTSTFGKPQKGWSSGKGS